MQSIPHDIDETPTPVSRVAAILIIFGYLALVSIGYVIVSGVIVVASDMLQIGGPVITLGPVSISFPVLAFMHLCIAVLVIVITLAFVLFVDGRSAGTFGLNRAGTWISETLGGVGLGLGMVALMFGVSCLAGWSRVTGSSITATSSHNAGLLVYTIIFMASVAVTEEVVMRGYILQKLRHGYGVMGALIISSILFGLVHSANPGASFAGFLGTTAAGVVMGYSYLVTERLWMPMGIHFAWNLAEGTIFGFPVSGADFPSYIHQKLIGPPLWTGGEFGPEAGLMTPLVLILGALVIWYFAATIYKSEN